jgi:ubiquinol-cytochrome c reductase cytochrome b subunit
MLLWHVTLLPIFVGMIVGLHLILVRRHGVVPPLDSERERHSAASASAFDPARDGASQ